MRTFCTVVGTCALLTGAYKEQIFDAFHHEASPAADIQDGLSGNEVRNANWRDSLRRFNALFGVVNGAAKAATS